MDTKMITAQRAARHLGLKTSRQVRTRIKRGLLDGELRNGRWYVNEAQVLAEAGAKS